MLIEFRTFSDPADFPPLIPILVGSTNRAAERAFGALLAPYLADPSSIFIASSDFCHWGSRFRYTYYQPSNGPATHLSSSSKRPTRPAIHESIAEVDVQCMDAVETGIHDNFLGVLQETGNTVFGRHPIGVVMAAVEILEKEGQIQASKVGSHLNRPVPSKVDAGDHRKCYLNLKVEEVTRDSFCDPIGLTALDADSNRFQGLAKDIGI
jgi:predicted class III extradiol MEMO1 family dioxygenase